MDALWRAAFAGLTLACVSSWQHGHHLKAEAWAIGLIAAWLLRAYFWPYTACWACGGKKTNRGSTRRRYGSCWRCKGSGMRHVTGARMVHRTVRGVRRKAWKSKREP